MRTQDIMHTKVWCECEMCPCFVDPSLSFGERSVSGICFCKEGLEKAKSQTRPNVMLIYSCCHAMYTSDICTAIFFHQGDISHSLFQFVKTNNIIIITLNIYVYENKISKLVLKIKSQLDLTWLCHSFFMINVRILWLKWWRLWIPIDLLDDERTGLSRRTLYKATPVVL